MEVEPSRARLRAQWRLASLLIALLGLCSLGSLWCSDAWGSITATTSASTLADAIVADPPTLVSASFAYVPNGGKPTATATTFGTVVKPWVGPVMAVLSNGDATAADTMHTQPEDGGTAPSNADNSPDAVVGGAHDVTVLKLNVDVPEYANCAAVNADYFTNDTPDYAYTAFVDGWIVRVDPSAMWTLPAPSAGGDPPPAGDLAVTAQGYMFDADAMTMTSAGPTYKPTQPYISLGSGTPYNVATGWHSILTPVTAGTHTFELSIFDRGDQNIDSTALFNGLSFYHASSCASGLGGSFPDTTPAVTLDSPANGSSTTGTAPVLSGSFATQRDDLPEVTVNIYKGTQASGSPFQTVSASDSGNGWSATPSQPLTLGTYTVQAIQKDLSGDSGLSSAHTFSVIPSSTPGGTGTAPGSHAECIVPRLSHKRLAAARRQLRKAHCSLGNVKRPKNARGKLVVVAQHPRAGTALARGAKVRLRLGPAPKHGR